MSCNDCCKRDEEIQSLKTEIEKLRSQIGSQNQSQNENFSSEITTNIAADSTSFVAQSTSLTKEQVERYSRQALLPECGPEGTKAFVDSKVIVIGCGGLGSTCILYLAASGIGHLVLVDADVVDRSNLHRQIIHADDRVGMLKVESAKKTAHSLNPTIRIDTYHERFGAKNADEILKNADLVVDCTDNVSARYVVNDACVRNCLPLVSGAAMRWDGQLSVYNLPLNADACSDKNNNNSNNNSNLKNESLTSRSPTYRCMHPNPPPVSTLGGCSDVGVFGPVPGAVGCLQAIEALKCIIYLHAAKRLVKQIQTQQQQENQNQNVAAAASSSSSSSKNNSPTKSQQQQQHHHWPASDHFVAGRMLVWDAYGGTVRIFKMRGRTQEGVEKSTCGELSQLGGLYDGCQFAPVNTEGVEVSHVSVKNLKENLLKLKDRQRLDETNNNNNNADNNNNKSSNGTRREREEITTTTIRGEQQQQQKQSEANIVNTLHQQQLMLESEVASQVAKFLVNNINNNDNDNDNNIKKNLNISLILDVRKHIQFRLCNLGDLYQIPSFFSEEEVETEEEKGSLVLQSSYPLRDLHHRFTLATTSPQKDTTAISHPLSTSLSPQQEHSAERHLLLSVSNFLSGLLCVKSIDGAHRTHDISQQQTNEISSSSGPIPSVLDYENISSINIYTLCRRGIDSTGAVVALEKMKQQLTEIILESPEILELLSKNNTSEMFQKHYDFVKFFVDKENVKFHNISGGLNSWSSQADERFPQY